MMALSWIGADVGYLAPLAGRGRIASAMRSIVRCNPGEGAIRESEPVESPPLSPQAAVLSREKSHIDELQLIEGEFWFWLAGIDWRRLVDFCDRNSREKALANQFSEAQVQHPQGVQSASDFYREPQSRLPCV